MNNIVWCIFDMIGVSNSQLLVAIVDDEDKAIQYKRNNPDREIEIEEWEVK